jgi:hypothetical protein
VAYVSPPMQSPSEAFSRATPRLRSVLVGLLLVPVVLAAWSIAHFRTPLAFPPDGVPIFLAARVWANGHPEAVYHGNWWLSPDTTHPAWSAEAAKLEGPTPDTSYGSSPVYLALARPVATRLSARQFLWVIALGNAIAALVLGYQSARRLTGVAPTGRWLIALGVAVSFPVSYGAILGQDSTMAAALVLCGFGLIASGGRERWIGLGLLILASTVKVWCVLFLAVLPLMRLWRLGACGAALYVGLLWVVPALLLPSELWSGYGALLTRVMTMAQLDIDDVSLRSLIARLSWPEWPIAAAGWGVSLSVGPLARGIEISILAFVGLVYAWLMWVRRPPLLPAGISAMGIAPMFVSWCWSHLLVFTLPMVILVIADRDSPVWVRGLAWILALWFANLRVAFLPKPENLSPPWAWALALSAPLLLSTSVVLLWLWYRPAALNTAGSDTGRVASLS